MSVIWVFKEFEVFQIFILCYLLQIRGQGKEVLEGRESIKHLTMVSRAVLSH